MKERCRPISNATGFPSMENIKVHFSASTCLLGLRQRLLNSTCLEVGLGVLVLLRVVLLDAHVQRWVGAERLAIRTAVQSDAVEHVAPLQLPQLLGRKLPEDPTVQWVWWAWTGTTSSDCAVGPESIVVQIFVR